MDNLKWHLLLLYDALRRMEKDGRLHPKDHHLLLDLIDDVMNVKLWE